MGTQIISIDKLSLAEYNPRKDLQPGDPEYIKLKRSIETYGCVENIVVNSDMTVIGGHQRVKVMRDLGYTEAECKVLNLTKKQEIALNVALNKISGEWDMPKLKDLLLKLDDGTFDMDLTGFDDDEIERLMAELPEDMENIDEKKDGALAEKYIIAPFSVLDTRSKRWLDRRNIWTDIGIKSEIGRGNDDDKTQNGLTFGKSAQPPQVYKKKEKYENASGKKISWEEFFALFPEQAHHGGTSIFDPVLCEIMYNWFCPKNGKIIDPFSGGSVRGIVAAINGFDYTGIDLSERQIQANQNNLDEILNNKADIEIHHIPKWINGDSADIKELAFGEYDLLFTCPPYADLEVYSNDEKDLSNMDYTDFQAAYFDIINKTVSLLKQNRFAAVVVGEVRDKNGIYHNFISDTIKYFTEAEMSYYNEMILINNFGSLPIRCGKPFEKSRKIGKTHQNILVFVKGDPKTAAKEIGGDYQDEYYDEKTI